MMKWIWNLLFPPKCVFCRKLLARDETDLCHKCRVEAPEFSRANIKITFVAGWTAVWYYRGDVRQSLLRYKFRNVRSYAGCYGRFLAMKLLSQEKTDFDLLTWIPVSPARKTKRGYDQVELIANHTASVLQIAMAPTLKKIRNAAPQSGISGFSQRRANIQGAYIVPDPDLVRGKRILLLDDIITTGATAGECARMLLTAGAKEVFCAAVAAATHSKKS